MKPLDEQLLRADVPLRVACLAGLAALVGLLLGALLGALASALPPPRPGVGPALGACMALALVFPQALWVEWCRAGLRSGSPPPGTLSLAITWALAVASLALAVTAPTYLPLAWAGTPIEGARASGAMLAALDGNQVWGLLWLGFVLACASCLRVDVPRGALLGGAALLLAALFALVRVTAGARALRGLELVAVPMLVASCSAFGVGALLGLARLADWLATRPARWRRAARRRREGGGETLKEG